MGIFNLRFVVFKKSLHFLYEAWVLNLTSVKGSQYGSNILLNLLNGLFLSFVNSLSFLYIGLCYYKKTGR